MTHLKDKILIAVGVGHSKGIPAGLRLTVDDHWLRVDGACQDGLNLWPL